MKDPLCKSGCYMFPPGPERASCENACRIQRFRTRDPHERTAFQCAARGCDGCSACEPVALPLTSDRSSE